MDEKLVREIVSRVVLSLLKTQGTDTFAGAGSEPCPAARANVDTPAVQSSEQSSCRLSKDCPVSGNLNLKCVHIPVGVSNRHVHITRGDFERLFGPGREMTVLRPLTQKGQFAAQETVSLATDSGRIDNVRILGPFREQTQVEVSRSDTRGLGLKAPVRESGRLAGTPGLYLEGPAGRMNLPEGVIVAERHIHLSPADAAKLRVASGQYVDVHTSGEREVVFHKVLVRVGEKATADFHIDTDEANAAGLKTGDLVEACVTSAGSSSGAGGGRVVTERMIFQALRGGQVPALNGNAILTPAARDLALEKGLLKR